jgi:dTDP-4-dehydrorhamnose reductase
VAQVDAAIQQYRPWAIINAAGYVDVDAAESDRDTCMRENVDGPEVLAAACEDSAIQFMTFSSDLVFDGQSDRPYIETDVTAPINVYGLAKAEAERMVLERMPGALIVRTSAFFGPWDQANFVWAVTEAARAKQPIRIAGDTIVSPTYVPDLVHASLDLLIDRASGIWHLSNNEPVSWAEFARWSLDAVGIAHYGLDECEMEDLQLPARRPKFTALSSSRSKPLLPCLHDALQRYACETTSRLATVSL